jgi:pentatricopeptide repeat protein
MYSQCGSFHNAYDIFKSAEHEEALNWNAIISAHTSCQHATKAIPTLYFFHQMLQEGILPYMTCTFVNIILGCAYRRALMEGKTIHAVVVGSKKDQIMMVGTALLNMYGKCGCIEDAYMTFSGISERNECLWKTMIAAYADTGYGKDALILFERMQWEGMIVDKLAMLYILSACSTQLLLSHAKQAHTYALATGFAKDSMVQNALVTMYSKCSCLCYAKKVSDLTSTRSLVSWTAKIAACAQHGQGEEAFSHFQHFQKEGCVLDEVMYAEVLIACSHCGLTEEAIHVFCCMKHQDNMTVSVDHYNCLIDLFTRIGRLEIAEHIILNMQPLRADAVSWITLLGGCQVQKDLERGERAAKWARDLFPEISASFVTLSNLYAHSGRFHDAACVMNQMWLLSQETQSTSTCKLSSENSKDKILNVDSM